VFDRQPQAGGLPASKSGVFRGIFAVQLHEKVRLYDACGWGRFSVGWTDSGAVEKLPRCGFLARNMLVEGRPMMAGYKRAGLSTPPFASSTERLNDQV
jgi:hypothetical protein